VRVTLVIATRRRPESLRATLASLARCEPLPAEVLVVDGDEAGSAGPIAEEARGLLGVPVGYVRSPAGLTRQRNAGVRAAGGDVVAFADDDVEFAPGTFAALAAAYDDPAVVGVTGRVVEHEPRRVGGARSRVRELLRLGRAQGTMTAYGYPRRLTDLEAARDVEFMHGCLMSARREAAVAVGFDERLPGYGLAEDEDFGYRLSRTGRVRYEPGASVVHLARGRSSAEQRAFNRTLVVNRSYLFRKSFDRGAASRLRFAALVALLAVHRALNGEWQGVRGLGEGAWAALRGEQPS
jgi:GT2 family glycosyltransferase